MCNFDFCLYRRCQIIFRATDASRSRALNAELLKREADDHVVAQFAT